MGTIIFIFLVRYWLLITPGYVLIWSLLKLMTFRGDMKEAGELIQTDEMEYKNSRFNKIYTTLMLLFGLYLVAAEIVLGYLILIPGVYSLLDNITEKKYYQVNGFYQNGLIRRTEFYAFKSFLNYDEESDTKIIIHLKDGGQMDYEPEYGLDLMTDKLEENNIQIREIP